MSRRIQSIAASGRVPLHCRPLQATIPGSRVALVATDGTVQLTCVIARITGPKRVLTADGKYKKTGYELIAKPGSMRAGVGALGTLAFRWRVIGQLRYFDQATARAVMIRGPEPGGTFLDQSSSEHHDEITRFKPFVGGVPGLPHDHPESKLVQRYVKWIASPEYFRHAQALPDGGYTDLFNTTRWTLFEAKASAEERRIREAFGQLFDYRRSFARSPSLAILAPSRPAQRLLTFLQHFGVAAVWERPAGFVDSVGGRLTRELRIEYKLRRANSA